MTIYKDEEGNDIEFELSPEEITALKASNDKLTEENKKIEELEKEVKERNDEISKFENKDLNFSKLRKISKQERDEMLSEYSEKEKMLINELAELKETVDSNKQASINSYEEEIINAMAGNDSDLKDNIKKTAKLFAGEVNTKDEILKRYKNAYTLVKESAPNINPINQFVPISTNEEIKSKKSWTETDEGKESYDSFFPPKK